MVLCEPVEYKRERKINYPFCKTSDKTVYNWLGYEIEKAKKEIETLNSWIAKCEELRAELKAKHKAEKLK